MSRMRRDGFSGKASDRLKARMGEPDGTRKGGEVYWLAIDRAGNCNEYVADPDGRIGHGSLPARDCGLAPAAGPSASSTSGRVGQTWPVARLERIGEGSRMKRAARIAACGPRSNCPRG